MLCANTEHILQEIRNCENAMASVHACRELERLADEASLRRTGEQVSPGVVLNIVTVSPPAPPAGSIELTPTNAPLIEAGE